MKQKNVAATVALERMYIYAGQLNMREKDTLAHTLLCGGTVTYVACDQFGKPIGRTRLEPENEPVATVTETTF